MKGYFITLEGGEGVGKTTIINSLRDELVQMGYKVLTTREPGGIDISEQVRKVILDPSNTAMDARTEALLYAAARRQHLVEKVFPALKEGKVVLCDRFIDSSLAYQGYARGLGIDEVFMINQFAIENCMPTLTLLLNMDPEKGLQRILINKDREVNRLDLETVVFHKLVYEGYQILTEKFPDRIVTINADQKLQDVEADALKVIISHLQDEKDLREV